MIGFPVFNCWFLLLLLRLPLVSLTKQKPKPLPKFHSSSSHLPFILCYNGELELSSLSFFLHKWIALDLCRNVWYASISTPSLWVLSVSDSIIILLLFFNRFSTPSVR
ncbi:unnamed protein product [Citrullus colocynthis]|uniref:Uncharacterized protein n=1 Tax=Citrullus colocynthis TaxID=252529 RepID=A0ABP0Y9H4_9ROSI